MFQVYFPHCVRAADVLLPAPLFCGWWSRGTCSWRALAVRITLRYFLVFSRYWSKMIWVLDLECSHRPWTRMLPFLPLLFLRFFGLTCLSPIWINLEQIACCKSLLLCFRKSFPTVPGRHAVLDGLWLAPPLKMMAPRVEYHSSSFFFKDIVQISKPHAISFMHGKVTLVLF